MVIVVLTFIILGSKGIESKFLTLISNYSYEMYLVEGYLIGFLIISNATDKYFALWIYVTAVIIMSYGLKKVMNIIFRKIEPKKQSIGNISDAAN